MKPNTTFTAEPFENVHGHRPYGPRSSNSHRHVKPEPMFVIDTTEPRDVTHAVAMRETLKRQIAAIHEALRSLTGYRRTETAKIAVAAQTRSGELLRWIRRANGANHEGLNSTNVVRALLDVLDRLADEGVTLTDADHDAIDRGAEFIALTEEQTAIRRALAAGKVPVAAEEP